MLMHGINILTIVVLVYISEYLYLKYKRKDIKVKRILADRKVLLTCFLLIIAYFFYMYLTSSL